MSTDTAVKYFDSTMSGAPELSGTAGSLIGVLDACLVNGFGSVTLDSLVIASNVATATVSTGHNFAMVGNVGPVIKIEGATPAELNVELRIQSIADVNTFTFATSGIGDQTATGTITAKRAPAGFSKAFSGTNNAAYRSDDIAGTRLYLRVDDSPVKYPTLIMYESMGGMDTDLAGPGPTTGAYYLEKSSLASSTARAWRLFADSRAFYLFILNDGNVNNWNAGMYFGDIVSFKDGDAYHCGLIANYLQSVTFYLYIVSNVAASLLARSYTQVGAAVAFSRNSYGGYDLGSTGMAYPNPVDNAFHAWPVEVIETSVARGLMPGLWNPRHDDLALPDQTIITDVPQLAAGGTLIVQRTNGTRRVALDITGPWR